MSAAGVKPVIGVDCWIQNPADRDKPFRALLLCSSRAGYLRLSELLSRAWLKNQHRARAELQMDWFREGTDGLIVLSGFSGGDVGHALATGNTAAAEKAAGAWSKLFPGRYYLEIQRAEPKRDRFQRRRDCQPNLQAIAWHRQCRR